MLLKNEINIDAKKFLFEKNPREKWRIFFSDEVFPDKVRVVTSQTELLTRIFLFLL